MTFRTELIYSNQTAQEVGKVIYGNHANIGVYASTEVIEHFGGVDETFQGIKGMQAEGLLPRMGSEGRPIVMRDINLYLENKQLGYRHWRWFQLPMNLFFYNGKEWTFAPGATQESTGYDWVYGYGYVDEQTNLLHIVEGTEVRWSIPVKLAETQTGGEHDH